MRTIRKKNIIHQALSTLPFPHLVFNNDTLAPTLMNTLMPAPEKKSNEEQKKEEDTKDKSETDSKTEYDLDDTVDIWQSEIT